MKIITLKINDDDAALLDAALSLLHQNIVSQIGAIKEGIAQYGNDEESMELLQGAQGIKKDIEDFQLRMERIQEANNKGLGKIKSLKPR